MAGEQQNLSTARVADALGLSVTTVKRWIDEGILPATRTAGGHRKVQMADVIRLAREGGLPGVDIAKLFPRSRGVDLSSASKLLGQLRTAVRDADVAQVEGLLLGAYRHGYAIEVLADQVIGPLLIEIGTDWELGKIGVMHEHRATQLIVAALYELKGELGDRVSRGRVVAAGGAPETDPTVVPSLLAQLVLMDAGWEAVNLGPNTPPAAFATAIDELKPRLLWVCVTHLTNPEAFLRDFLRTYRLAEDRGIAVAVGGGGLTKWLRERMPYTTFGDGMSHLAAFARTLAPKPAIPKKGRPTSRTRESD